MYTAVILSAVENEVNPDQVTVVVEYSNGTRTFTRQYDWLSNSISAETVELTIKDELRKMNTDTLSVLQALTPKIGLEISL